MRVDYITGERLASLCDYVFDPSIHGLKSLGLKRKTPIIYIKTDYIPLFWNFLNSSSVDFLSNFSILTHNSDFGISSQCIPLLEHKGLIKWYAQNIELDHPKLISVPIGIANSEWPHGDLAALEGQASSIAKLKKPVIDIYFNFSVETNIVERLECENKLKSLGLKKRERVSFPAYLEELKSHFFCASPNGNGIDCHKTWECLYLGVSPIVTKSINSLQYKDYPILLIDSWKEFDLDCLTQSLYNNLWKNFNKEKLKIKHYESLFNS
jgi:hypothetical protein